MKNGSYPVEVNTNPRTPTLRDLSAQGSNQCFDILPRDIRFVGPTPDLRKGEFVLSIHRLYGGMSRYRVKQEPRFRNYLATSSSDSALEPIEELPGTQDRDSPERIQGEQINVTGNDRVGTTIECNLEKRVILRISTDSNRMTDLNPNRDAGEHSKKGFPVARLQVSVKFRTGDDSIEFGQAGTGE